MKYGRLQFNEENQRYGIVINDEWYHEGLHCGEGLEVFLDGKWIQTGIEMSDSWYIPRTPYKKNLENIPVRIR